VKIGHGLMSRPEEHPKRNRGDRWLVRYFHKAQGFHVGWNAALLVIHLMALAAPSLCKLTTGSNIAALGTGFGAATN
jgi:hypothetical protein